VKTGSVNPNSRVQNIFQEEMSYTKRDISLAVAGLLTTYSLV